MLAQSVLWVLVLCAAASGATKLPKEFKRCKKGAPNQNECLREAIQGSLEYLRKACPWTRDRDQIKLTFSDLDILGLTSAVVDSADVNWDEYRVSYEASLRKPLVLKGRYTIKGQVLILPIQGAGASNITLEKVRARMDLSGRPLVKGGQTYLDVDKTKLKFTTERMHLRFDNLFNGDKALGDNMNRFLNENWTDILKELQPSIESALAETFRQVANRIFHKVPLNQIYL